MRKTIFFSALCLCFSHTHAQISVLKDDSITKRAQRYYSKFIGKPVYEFLLDDSIRNYEEMRFSDEPPGKLRGVSIRKNRHDFIRAIVCKFSYLNQESNNRIWDKNLFYKEEICRLLFYKNDTLYLDVRDTSIIKK